MKVERRANELARFALQRRIQSPDRAERHAKAVPSLSMTEAQGLRRSQSSAKSKIQIFSNTPFLYPSDGI